MLKAFKVYDVFRVLIETSVENFVILLILKEEHDHLHSDKIHEKKLHGSMKSKQEDRRHNNRPK